LQDEILLGEHVRWLVGARWDDIDPIGSVVSPRTSVLLSPDSNHTFRLSFNRAFRAPSLIQNYLDVVIVNQVVLPTGPYIFPSVARGNADLQEEQLDAIEVGWVGSFGSTTATLSIYRNETQDSQDFFTAGTYTAANPPPGFPLPAFVLDIPPPLGLAGLLPSAFSYRNIGEIVDQGAEFSLQARPSLAWSWFFNYSFQDEPEVSGIPADEVNTPPESRFNLGVGYDAPRWFANANVNYQDEAFWTDVLDSRFFGPTDSFAQLNLAVGFRFADDRATFQINGQNVLDEDVQQHVFGDIIGRKVSAQVSYDF
jgi:outer membrane receptor protein involved in Fe transport